MKLNPPVFHNHQDWISNKMNDIDQKMTTEEKVRKVEGNETPKCKDIEMAKSYFPIDI